MSQLNWYTILEASDAPTTAGVYMYMKASTPLYIGKAVNLKARLASHVQNAKLDAREAAYVTGAADIRYAETDTEFKALLLEASLIQKYQPRYNRALKDDKSYLYIVINTSDEFPKPVLARAHDLQRQNNTYKIVNKKYKVFGPFPNSYVAEEVLRTIRRLVPFCQQKSRSKNSRACFYHHLGLCDPCPSTITTAEDKRRYRHQIFQVIHILEGNIDPVIAALTKDMKAASAREDFESALRLRQKIERFTRYIESHSFSRGEHISYNTADLRLNALRTLLSSSISHLESLSRIEAYDASHLGMADATVSMVVATDGLLDRGAYRRFRVKNPRAVSDFDRLEEAMVRRLKNTHWPAPDLIVIDGGTPQLRRLQRVFDQLPSPPRYLGLAKHPDRLILQGPSLKESNWVTIHVPSNNPGLHLLEELRDEAHRFANNYRKVLGRKRSGL